MSATILVVEDEPAIQTLVAACLQNAGHQVVRADTAEEAIRKVNEILPDVVLLDWMLPGRSGVALARQLRAEERTRLLPIIMLTARGHEDDKIEGLDAGADDYVTKPFDLRELLARVRSVLRRSNRARPSSAGDEHAALHFSGFRLDPLARELFTADGERVALTAGEYELLRLFVDNPNRVLSRDDLMERIHGREAGPFDRAIDVRIGRLRRKIESDPSEPEIIKSVRGAGYVFATRVSRGES